MDALIMATKKLKYITDTFDDSFNPYVIDGICQYAPTGEAFVTYCSSGSKPEGAGTKVYPSELEAVDAFGVTIRNIISMGRGTLYWRQKPKLETRDQYYFVRSRFRISDKPIDPTCYEKYYAKRIEEQRRRFEEIYDSTVGWFD